MHIWVQLSEHLELVGRDVCVCVSAIWTDIACHRRVQTLIRTNQSGRENVLQKK